MSAALVVSAMLTQADAQTAGDQPSSFDFAAPPSTQANRLYSVNTATGEVSACQFERPDGSLVGVTRCFPRDASAAAQAKLARFRLVTTNYSSETGVFRVNQDTGEMSVCYVREMPKSGATEAQVVCTPAVR
ncbi:hypothetical protein MWN34_01530 [Ancylobacter sp. 6x-1]|uniref:Uncharacterized protein n=1 Tax=Ancylobacter crimeensis TaxID=2579147 RepID=A0ABT0D6K9_9HYPH|nr:hypothetical protein [Ancylobacter crimeensis]MCK0195586.1 hypothetical protein [Ancylobacter crimeensis]